MRAWSPRDVSVPGALTMVVGLMLSIASICGDPLPPDTGLVLDTGTPREDIGFTLDGSGVVNLVGDGTTQVVTVRTTLPASCLATVPDYGWGYPTGWLQLGWDLQTGPGDTGGGGGTETGGADTGGAETGGADTAAARPPSVDDSGVDTATAADTGETGGMDTGAADTGIVDTGVVDTNTVDTGVLDTGTLDTGPVDTGDTSLDTADSAVDTGPASDARVKVVVTRSDALEVSSTTMRLYDGASEHGSATDNTPYKPCVADEECVVTWQVAFTLAAGESAHGTLDAHARLRMCSSGEATESDMVLEVE
jgi:hypothetical protein